MATRCFVLVFLLSCLLHAQGPGTAHETPDGDLLAKTKPSATEVIRLLDLGATESSEHRIVVEVNGKRTPLPAVPEDLEASKEGAWTLPARPDFLLSQDGRWIFATQKVCTGYSIGCLYQRHSGGAYRVSTPIRFDAQAWKFFAEQEEVAVEELLASDSPAHLIDALALNSHFLVLRLRGAVFEIPHDKAVPQRPENSIDETGVYDWCCVYDLGQGRFFVTEDMQDHNAGAWKRWASGDNFSWETDTLVWLKAVEERLTGHLKDAELAAFREEQAAWGKLLEQKRPDKNFSTLDFIRERAGKLEIELLQLNLR